MSLCIWQLMLLAEKSPLDHMSENFRHDESQFGLVGFLIALAALVSFALLSSWLINRFARPNRRGLRSPRSLFRELCNAHHLDRDSRRLLTRLARHCRLSQPAGVFIDARCFDPETWSNGLSCHSSQLLSLRERLFGSVVSLD